MKHAAAALHGRSSLVPAKNRIRQNLCAALFEHPFFELAGLAGTELSFRISFPDFCSLISTQRTLHTA
jgi:hypothetical protein